MGKRCVDGCTCGLHRGAVFRDSYESRHNRLNRARGSAAKHLCARCEQVPAKNWAAIHTEDGDDPWADYVPLCLVCHRAYDKHGAALKRNYALNGYAEDRKEKQRAAALQRPRDLWCEECGAGPFQKSGLGAHTKYRHTGFKRGASE